MADGRGLVVVDGGWPLATVFGDGISLGSGCYCWEMEEGACSKRRDLND